MWSTGALGATRTRNLRIRSPALCPLSYEGRVIKTAHREQRRARGVSGGIRTHGLLGHNQVP